MRNSRITYLCCLLILPLSLLGQISPGELTKAHSSLEGISNCSKCHEVGKKVLSARCLGCHTEIKSLIDQKKGYHASTEVTGKECFSCHNEHHGKNFQIIRFDTLKFSHVNTGYELTGKHRSISCVSCHKPQLVKVKTSKRQTGSYLGLGSACLDCHADYHQQSLPANCLICHNTDAFKPVTGFNHAKTAFPLVGSHLKVECTKCHKVVELNGKKTPKFKGIAYAKCTDCHKDVHDNKFGQDCRKCHNEESFKKAAGSKTFNHDKTDYPLRGKHVNVACKSCHKESMTAKISFSLCSNCHKDYHKGQFRKSGTVRDCKECHTVAGFTTSDFSIDKHNKTAYPLTGPHMATPCFNCHKKGTEWVFRDMKKRCADCHKNIHESNIDVKYFGNQECDKCHEVSIWSKVKFDHNTTRFKLAGKHAETACKKCHFKQDAGGTVKQQFSQLKGGCLECHTDEHNGQFETDEDNSCTRCHGFEKWKPVHFNHDESRFKLDNNHKDVACVKCHKQVTEGGRTYTQYKVDYMGDIRCINCHLR